MIDLTWELLEQIFTVETIMTPRDRLTTHPHGADVQEIRDLAEQHGFDLIPLEQGGKIVHLWTGTQDLTPLTRDWLVSRDTSIPDLLALFVESKWPGLLVLHRQEIVGIVSPADLNKMPARHYVYNLLGELEMMLASRIRISYEDCRADCLKLLSSSRQEQLEEHISDLKEGDVDIDPVEVLRLSDLITIVAKSESLRCELGFSSRSAVKDALGGLNKVRNDTMHLVRSLLQGPDDMPKLHERLERTRTVLQQMSQPPDHQSLTTDPNHQSRR